jgi:2-oxoglutarate ferredoxin oxidoreductase subunit beta
VEIYQNCNIFNDDAFEVLKNPATRDEYLIRLEHGSPVTFGAEGEWCVTHPPGAFGLEVRKTNEVPAGEILVHDETVPGPAYAFALSRLPQLDLRYTPIGVFRNAGRPSYDSLVRDQVETAKATVEDPDAELASLLSSGDTWTIV